MRPAALPAVLALALLPDLGGLAVSPAVAQTPLPGQGVVRDGTLGSLPKGLVAPGPDDLGTADYLIHAELGERRGDNLFHSFEFFSIASGERATFTGPDGIEHVISRVTGGELSRIDGTLHSTIAGADVWLLNPSGVVFGPGAELDVPDSFHAGTGDYLGFGEGGLERFHAREDPSRPSVLSTATPSAFGFLPGTTRPASLVVDRSRLAVPQGGALELVGGELSLAGATLLAPGGQVRLEAQDEIGLTDSFVDVGREGDTPGTISIRGGQIVIREGSDLFARNASPVASADPSEPGPGSITVTASRSVLVDNARLSVSTRGAGTRGNAGTIEVRAGALELRNEGFIDISTNEGSGGDAGRAFIHASSLEIHDRAGVDGRALGGSTGKAGSIEVHADSVRIGPGDANLTVTSRAGGDAGDILVEATERIELSDEGGERFTLDSALNDRGELFLTGVYAFTVDGGDGGSIELKAPEITISEGAVVGTSTLRGGAAGDVLLRGNRIRIVAGGWVDSTSVLTTAPAGSVTLEAIESIEVVGRHPEHGDASRVASATLNSGAAGDVTLRAPRILVDGGAVSTAAVPLALGETGGMGGDITLEGLDGAPARDILVRAGGRVEASTLGSGAGGDILARASESIRVDGSGDGIASGIASRTGADGRGGDVELRAPRIEVVNGGEISARSAPAVDDFGELGVIFAAVRDAGLLRPPLPLQAVTGDAGVVRLRGAETVRLVGGSIATNAAVANGGNIEIHASRLVHLVASDISASVTGATGGEIRIGEGGSIGALGADIDPVFVILQDGSQILATANQGRGGLIRITTDNFFAFPGSVISAVSGNQELSGTVEVHSPDVDLAGTLTPLPSGFLDAASLMRERCAARRSGERAGSFSVRGPGGIPAEPDGWLPAPLVLDTTATSVAAGPPALLASLPGPLLASRACR